MIGDNVFIPEGSFLFGSREDDKKASSKEKPQKMLSLSPYWIDAHLITNRYYSAFLNTVDSDQIKFLINLEGDEGDGKNKCRIYKNDQSYLPEEGYEDHPVVYVSYNGAFFYAQCYGKRLLTQGEWERASRGVLGNVYPWGDEFDKEACNHGYIVETTTPVDKYPPNGVGCYDMAGNVMEWTSDVGKKGNIVRGGSWGLSWRYCRCACWLEVPKETFSSEIGFRCASQVR